MPMSNSSNPKRLTNEEEDGIGFSNTNPIPVRERESPTKGSGRQMPVVAQKPEENVNVFSKCPVSGGIWE